MVHQNMTKVSMWVFGLRAHWNGYCFHDPCFHSQGVCCSTRASLAMFLRDMQMRLGKHLKISHCGGGPTKYRVVRSGLHQVKSWEMVMFFPQREGIQCSFDCWVASWPHHRYSNWWSPSWIGGSCFEAWTKHQMGKRNPEYIELPPTPFGRGLKGTQNAFFNPGLSYY